MSELQKFAIVRLNNTNYHIWKFKVELVLIKDGLWDVVMKPKPNPETADWIKKNAEARAVIGLSVEDSQLSHILKCDTAKDAWEILKKYHEKDTLSNKVQLMRKICSLKFEGGNMEDHIDQMTMLFLKLDALSETDKLPENWIVAMLLSSLGSRYDTLITALETRPEKDLTLELVQSKLLEECKRQSKGEIRSDALLSATRGGHNSNNSNKKSVECFFCHKRGHVKAECRKFIKWKSNRKEQSVNTVNDVKGDTVVKSHEYCFCANTSKFNWIVDSGATSHMINDRSLFSKCDEIVDRSVVTANNEMIAVSAAGECVIKLYNHLNKESTARLKNVLYVPTLNGNLMSVNKLTEAGFDVQFADLCCYIKFKGKVVAVADKSEGLYKLKQKVCSESSLKVNHAESCIHYWHRVFGHRDVEAIKLMIKEHANDKVVLSECRIKEVCDTCLKGKMSRTPFPDKSSSVSSAPLDLIHTDICGPMQTSTRSGKRYVLTFIDDYSRYTVVYLLSNKSEVEEKVQQYVSLVENVFGRKPKKIRSDRGGEYISNKYVNNLEKQGIQLQYTAAYSPQQNGVAERKNRYLVEMARCMLSDANMGNIFWGEAIMTANYMQNRLPTRSIKSTPLELWEGRKPNVGDFHIFGSQAYVHIPDQNRRKLDRKAELLTFVGYDEQSKAYRFLNKTSYRITISRDVKFVDRYGCEAGITSKTNSDTNKENSSIKVNSSNEESSSGEGSSEIYFDISRPMSQEANLEEVQEEVISEQAIVDERERVVESPITRKSERSNKGKAAVRYDDEFNLSTGISNCEVVIPENYNDAILSKEKQRWMEAMDEEMASLQSHDTWELVQLPEGSNVVGCKWVYNLKYDESNEIQRFKARLVAQGCTQRYGIDYSETFAPVARNTTLRVLLSIAGREKMDVYHVDVKTAFLHGELDETIYMKQPPGYATDDRREVCKLNKSIYGLKQSARTWNQAIHAVLIESGCQQSQVDHCLYSKTIDGGKCYIITYVDDVIIASSNQNSIKEIIGLLSKRFEMKNLGKIKNYLGLEIDKDDKGNFRICQSKYIKNILKDASLGETKSRKYPMSPQYRKTDSNSEILPDNKRYQRLIGCLLYIAVNSRPDISASVSMLGRQVNQPTKEDWIELKGVLKYLKGTVDLKLNVSAEDKTQELYGYVDADWAENRDDRKSNTGYIFKLNGGAISWACRKQSCVSLSSAEAEYVALAEGCQEALWLRMLIGDFGKPITQSTKIMEDNQSCIKLSESEKFSNRTKHIDTKFHFIKQYVQDKVIELAYCPTEEMVADMLTKPLSANKIEYLRIKCGLN